MRTGTNKVSSRSSLPEETVLSNHIRVGNAPHRHRHVATPVPMAQGKAMSYSPSGPRSSLGDHRRQPCLRITSTKGTKGALDFFYLLLISFFTSCFLGASLSPSIFYFLSRFLPLMTLVVFYSCVPMYLGHPQFHPSSTQTLCGSFLP